MRMFYSLKHAEEPLKEIPDVTPKEAIVLHMNTLPTFIIGTLGVFFHGDSPSLKGKWVCNCETPTLEIPTFQSFPPKAVVTFIQD